MCVLSLFLDTIWTTSAAKECASSERRVRIVPSDVAPKSERPYSEPYLHGKKMMSIASLCTYVKEL